MTTKKRAVKAGAGSAAKDATAKKSVAKKSVAKKAVARKAAPKSMPKAGQDPRGGLTAAGRKFFNEKEGSHLRPGVKGPADTPDKKVRKGSFLTRHFTHPRGPMQKDGEPTRLALSAQAWGEPMPRTEAEAKRLAGKGRELLKEYHKEKDAGAAAKKGGAGRKAAGGIGVRKSAAKKQVPSEAKRTSSKQ